MKNLFLTLVLILIASTSYGEVDRQPAYVEADQPSEAIKTDLKIRELKKEIRELKKIISEKEN